MVLLQAELEKGVLESGSLDHHLNRSTNLEWRQERNPRHNLGSSRPEFGRVMREQAGPNHRRHHYNRRRHRHKPLPPDELEKAVDYRRIPFGHVNHIQTV